MFSFIKNTLSSLYSQFSSKLSKLFLTPQLDSNTLKELEQILIQSDMGSKTTHAIIDNLKNQYAAGTLQKGTDLQDALKTHLLNLLSTPKTFNYDARIILMVGINGSGKTTFTSKLAHHYAQQGKKVLLVAADTFRAAATEQLNAWAQRTNTQIVTGTQGQDPASVVFLGCERFKKEQFDIIIIDTAGRLQTKTNLMRELEKIKKIITKQLPDVPMATLLTVDAMLGQNSREQAKIFHESTQLDGIVLTKMDGTAKGGTVFAIAHEFGIPIAYISFGEQMDQCKKFNAQEFVLGLLSKE